MSKSERSGCIRAVKGHRGGLRAALAGLGPAAFGLAALASGVAGAQEQPAPPPPSEPTGSYTLPTVEVEGEGEGEYNPPSSELPRVAKPLVDTPQQVTVVPEQVLEDQQATTVRDALRNVSGITVSAGEGGRQGDTFNLRGFSGQTDVFRDGGRDLGWFTRDTFNLAGVEVFFGPSSVLFGRGSTGGAINLVTKSPERRNFSDVQLTGGTAPSGRVEADINQVLTDRVQLRVNAMGQLGDVAGRDHVNGNRLGVAPSVAVELGEKTRVHLDYFYQRERGVPDYGQPFFDGSPVSTNLGVDRRVFYGVTGMDTEQVDAHVATGRLEHEVSDAVKLTNTLRFGRVDRFALPTAPRGLTPATAPTSIGRQRFQTETDNTYLFDQADLRLRFPTAFLTHSANVGLELSREWRDQARDNLNAIGLPTGPNLPADLFNPDPSPDLSAVENVFQSASATNQYTIGAYASDQIELTKWLELLGSARFDYFETRYRATDAKQVTTTFRRSDGLFNWRAGVVVHPVEATTLYAMYGTSANPSAELGTLPNGSQGLDPEKNAVYEAGAKADLFDGRLSLSGSAFRIEKLNARVPNTDPEGPPQILAGKQRVQGLSAGVAGTLLERWQLLASYTYMPSEILEHSNPFLVGQDLPNTPRHSGSLWTTVEVLPKLSVGGGAVFQSATAANNPASESIALNRVPGYWRFDAVASYRWTRYEAQLNLNNLTNRLYFEQYSGAQAVPVAERSATLSLKARF